MLNIIKDYQLSQLTPAGNQRYATSNAAGSAGAELHSAFGICLFPIRLEYLCVTLFPDLYIIVKTVARILP